MFITDIVSEDPRTGRHYSTPVDLDECGVLVLGDYPPESPVVEGLRLYRLREGQGWIPDHPGEELCWIIEYLPGRRVSPVELRYPSGRIARYTSPRSLDELAWHRDWITREDAEALAGRCGVDLAASEGNLPHPEPRPARRSVSEMMEEAQQDPRYWDSDAPSLGLEVGPGPDGRLETKSVTLIHGPGPPHVTNPWVLDLIQRHGYTSLVRRGG
jgi:hypothetical protein